MEIKLEGMASLKAARVFASLVYQSRLNPLVIEREWDTFIAHVIGNCTLLYDFDQDELEAILSCVHDPDPNGINAVDLIDSLDLDKIYKYITAVMWAINNMRICRDEDLWEGYPLDQALELLMSKNPSFKLKELLELARVAKGGDM